MKAHKSAVTMLVILLVLIISIAGLLITNTDIHKVFLIDLSQNTVDVCNIEPGDSVSQDFYAYKAFDDLVIQRTNADDDCPLRVVLYAASDRENPIVDQIMQMKAGSRNGEINDIIGGDRGTYCVEINNIGENAVAVSMTNRDSYDIDYGIKSENNILNIGIYKQSAYPLLVYIAIVSILAIACAMFLYRAWKGSKNHGHSGFVCAAMVAMAFMMLLPAWNINDYDAHLPIAYEYFNKLLGIENDTGGVCWSERMTII